MEEMKRSHRERLEEVRALIERAELDANRRRGELAQVESRVLSLKFQLGNAMRNVEELREREAGLVLVEENERLRKENGHMREQLRRLNRS